MVFIDGAPTPMTSKSEVDRHGNGLSHGLTLSRFWTNVAAVKGNVRRMLLELKCPRCSSALCEVEELRRETSGGTA